MPTVSVLLPVYNAGPYVAEAVNSILQQSHSDLELLIIDDGSSDESLPILRSFADPRIRLVSRENRGLIATLNELIAMARGKYLARMDADDISEPHRLATQIDFLERHPDVGAVGSRGLLIDSRGNALAHFHDALTHADIDAALMQAGLGIIHPALVMRRETIDCVGAYRGDYPHAEDLDLLLRIGERFRLHNLPGALLRYRVHDSSVSRTHAEAQWTSAWAAVRDARRRRGLPPVDTPARAPQPSRNDLHCRWGWFAHAHGNLPVARDYALRAVRGGVTSRANWRLLFVVLRDAWRASRSVAHMHSAFKPSQIA